MSDSTISAQISALENDIININAQIVADQIANPGAIPGLQAQAQVDLGQIATLEASLCLAAGTNILTDRGEVRVEDLRVGDLVVTPHASADCMPVRWIGRQHYRGARVGYGQPVLIRAGALGDGLPHRDLRVSADHSLFLDGSLVPARLLVNGATIVAETGHAEMRYFNPEFDCHTAILAEGVETESYLDCGNRSRFDNAREPDAWLSTRPARDAGAWLDGSAFAPLLWEGPTLTRLRSRLAGCAVVTGTDHEPSADRPAPAGDVAPAASGREAAAGAFV